MGEIHWKATLMAINPQGVERHDGVIRKTVYADTDQPVLTMMVEREDTSQGGIFYFGRGDYDTVVKGEDPIRKLYDDFGVKEDKELVGREVTGLYFLNNLVGLEKKE